MAQRFSPEGQPSRSVIRNEEALLRALISPTIGGNTPITPAGIEPGTFPESHLTPLDPAQRNTYPENMLGNRSLKGLLRGTMGKR